MKGEAGLFGFLCIIALCWVFLGLPFLPKKKKRSTNRQSNRSFPGSDKPFPHSRPPDRSSPNPFHAAPVSLNPLELDVPVQLEDRFVYWEDEEGLHCFDEQGEWEEEDEQSEQTTHSGLSPIMINFPPYDYSIDYSEYKKWMAFCVKVGHEVPYRIFREFDENSDMSKN
ncbi:hypothetical protein ACR42D_10095 [Desulfovibrio caledoniensis]